MVDDRYGKGSWANVFVFKEVGKKAREGKVCCIGTFIKSDRSKTYKRRTTFGSLKNLLINGFLKKLFFFFLLLCLLKFKKPLTHAKSFCKKLCSGFACELFLNFYMFH